MLEDYSIDRIKPRYKPGNDFENEILVSGSNLCSLLGGCTDKTALKIATRAQAHVKIDDEDFWVVSKIEDYLRKIAK